jgi:glycosyltransferase involved in cell wall biosynthesis
MSKNSNKRSVRVLFVDDHLGFPGGVVHGVTTYHINIQPAFDRSRATPFVAILRSYHPAAKTLAELDTDVTFFSRKKWDPRALVDIIKLIHKLDIDVVHANGAKSHLLSRIAGVLTRTKVIIHLHFSYKPRPVWLCRILAKKTAMVITVSNVLRQQAVDDFAIPVERVRTIYLPIDIARFANPAIDARSRIRQEFELGEARSVITVCGRITTQPDKGPVAAIRMFAKLCERSVDAILLFAGDGPARSECEKLAQRLGIEDRVRFAGQRNDIPDILAAADIQLVPSIVEEAFGYAAIEAMCAKRPVIASNVGGLGEALGNGERGFLVNMEDVDSVVDVFERLIAKPSIADKKIECAWEFVSKLTTDEHIRQLYDVYDDIFTNSTCNANGNTR